jgi:chromosome segregation ATPase
MSGIANQVFDRLRAGEPPSKVRASVKSEARFAEGLQMFLSWAPLEAEKFQREIAKQDSTHQEFTTSNNALMVENEDLRSENSRLLKELQERSDQLEKVSEEAQKQTESLKNIRTEIRQHRENGYTEEVMLAISKSDATNGAETLRRIQTTQMVEAEEKALKDLKDDQGKVSRKVDASEVRLHELQKREQETVNWLSKMQEEAQLIEDSVKVTKTLMERYGLRDQDFKNLMYLTTRGGTPGVPGQTMERVRLVLDQYRTLAKLEAEIKGRGETLQKLDSEIGKAEERLATSTNAFADESKRIEDFVENIQASAKKSTDATIATLTRLEALAAKDIDKTLGVVTEKATGSLKEAQTKASGALGEVLKQSREILTDIRATNNDLTGQLGILVKDTSEYLLRQSKIVLEEMQATSREMTAQQKAQLEEY